MSKKTLLVQAKSLNIVGRHDMSVVALQAAIAAVVKPTVVRKGHNLSGNVPYRAKIYSATKVTNPVALKKEPNQVQNIVAFIAESGIADTGAEIVIAAVAAGALATKTKNPAAIFAYYAKRIGGYGVDFEYA